MEVLPVYVTVVGALFSVKVFFPVLVRRTGTVVVSPPNDPVRVYVPPGSFGVTVQLATPLALVVAVHFWVPFTVRVTGSLGTGVLVTVFTSVADTVLGVL